MRIAIVYDCIYPHTVGGAERVYVHTAERLAHSNDVTYLTAKQWEDGELRDLPFAVEAVSPGGALYTDDGRRRIKPPLTFGWGVFWHLLRHAQRYDAVQSVSFPFFSVIGAKLALTLRRSKATLVVDWFEVWTKDYWIEYLGPAAGRVGYTVQRLCMRLPDHNFTYSKMYERRLAEVRGSDRVTRLTGAFEEPVAYDDAGLPPNAPHVVFVGRHIPEKQVAALPSALAGLFARLPNATATIYGDGPELQSVRAEVERLDLANRVKLPGFVVGDEIRAAVRNASCLVLPSRREGYGVVVLEAMSAGTPAVLVEGPDNAATELVEPGVSGVVARNASAPVLSAAIEQAIAGGQQLRDSTFDHYRRNRERFALSTSLSTVEDSYRAMEQSRH